MRVEKEFKKPVIIDTDPGVDDLVSIFWVIANDEYEIKALTITNGNVGVDKCVINALRALELCNRTEIPVFKGAYRPILKEAINAEWYHGKDGLGDLDLPMPKLKATKGYAPVEMIRIVKESSLPVTLLCLGPLTNIAISILLDEDFRRNIEKIIFMGGAGFVSGNETPRASYNVRSDAEAAKIVYESGIRLVQIGLDVCDFVTQSESDVEKILLADTPVSQIMGKLLENRKDRQLTEEVLNLEKQNFPLPIYRKGIGLNDLTATGYLLYPELFDVLEVNIEIETNGICEGETVVDVKGLTGNPKNALFAYNVDGNNLVKKWVNEMSSFKG